MKKTALIAGATGLTGSYLLQHLIRSDAYEKIKILTRKPLYFADPKVEVLLVDFDNLTPYKDKLHAHDVFCCMGTTIKKAKSKEAFKLVDLNYPLSIARLTKEMGAEQFLLISSMGANQNSMIFYSKVKGILENEIKKAGFVSLHIFRPSLLLGKRNEFRLGEKAGIVLYNLFSWIFIGKLRKYKGIKAEKVALGMFKAAQLNIKGIHTYESDKIATI